MKGGTICTHHKWHSCSSLCPSRTPLLFVLIVHEQGIVLQDQGWRKISLKQIHCYRNGIMGPFIIFTLIQRICYLNLQNSPGGSMATSITFFNFSTDMNEGRSHKLLYCNSVFFCLFCFQIIGFNAYYNNPDLITADILANRITWTILCYIQLTADTFVYISGMFETGIWKIGLNEM